MIDINIILKNADEILIDPARPYRPVISNDLKVVLKFLVEEINKEFEKYDKQNITKI
jgi:hypothetical protein